MTNAINTQQVLTQAIVSVMSVNIVYSMMGMAMGIMGPDTLDIAPSDINVSQAALNELGSYFGTNYVLQARKTVGSDNLIAIAKETERLITKDMVAKYGELATQSALFSAPFGDVKAAEEMAKELYSRGMRGSSIQEFLQNASQEKIAAVAAVATSRSGADTKAAAAAQNISSTGDAPSIVKRGTKWASHEKCKVLDTKTGITYDSLNACGKAVALEFGVEANQYAFYKVQSIADKGLSKAQKEVQGRFKRVQS